MTKKKREWKLFSNGTSGVPIPVALFHGWIKVKRWWALSDEESTSRALKVLGTIGGMWKVTVWLRA